MKTKKMIDRKLAFNQMANMVSFNNKIVILGYGSIGTALLPLLLKIIKIDPKNITVIDQNNDRFKNIILFANMGVHIINIKLTSTNIKQIIIDNLGLGQDDIIIDASYEINTNLMYTICSEYGISYQNSAVEVWPIEPSLIDTDYTFYQRFKSIEEQNNKVIIKKNNFIISLGCNPGNVNVWALYALIKINKITHNYPYTSYAELAKKLGLCTIQISEKDTQITNNPKRQFEYLNTWSSDATSWYDEAFSFLEIGWGTHEKTLPIKMSKEMSNECQIIIDGVGSNTYAYSYTARSKNILGMIIRHEECYTICNRLTLKDANNNILYKPSCFYVYKPCDSAVASIIEVNENYDIFQQNKRLMTSDIIEGRDELGCTLYFANGDVYWIGSLLDIKEARLIYNNQYDNIINATILQVIAGYLGGIIYLIKSIENKTYKGMIVPEDLPIKQFLKWTYPLLGPFGLMKVDDWELDCKDKKNLWQFGDFLL